MSVIIKSSSAWIIRRRVQDFNGNCVRYFFYRPILSHRLITRRPDKPDWELSTSTCPAGYNFYGESSCARGRRDRFNVVDGKTSVLDSTDSSSAAIAISGLPLARLPSAKRARDIQGVCCSAVQKTSPRGRKKKKSRKKFSSWPIALSNKSFPRKLSKIKVTLHKSNVYQLAK